jgi:hypothetical protein
MNYWSKRTIIFILIFLFGIRFFYASWDTPDVTKVLTWDAFGYYLLLPGKFIYKDVKQMQWIEGVKDKYQTTGNLYQVSTLPNGNRVMKYLIGISILYAPFFLVGHACAGIFDLPQDGFSAPYQLAISFAALFYAFLGLWVLGRVLLRYFSDAVASVTLILVALATNYPQYVSVDSAMTHGYIFTLYALLLWATLSWHDRPNTVKAFFIGAVMGLGVISRPTEAVMIFIPLLYGMQDPVSKQRKWKLVRQHRSHIFFAFIGGLMAVFPQLLYWKTVTGGWIYDVGSKWTFLQPHWQILFGWEKGWFIYTPVVVLMVMGLFYFKKNPFYRSVLIFFIINTWIVLAWSDWRYGASYSARALLQSYAVMALPMAVMVSKAIFHRLKYLFMTAGLFLVFLNLFQIWQYNKTILHYDDMNRRYYQAIFLNPHPTPLQYSLLDTDEYVDDENKLTFQYELKIDSAFEIHASKIDSVLMYQSDVSQLFGYDREKEYWIKISAKVFSDWGAFDSNLITRLTYGAENKQTNCRMQNGSSKGGECNPVEYYFKIPPGIPTGQLNIWAETTSLQTILVRDVTLKMFLKE